MRVTVMLSSLADIKSYYIIYIEPSITTVVTFEVRLCGGFGGGF